MNTVRVLLILALVASVYTLPLSQEVHEVYENGEDDNPILNLGAGSDANLFEGDILIPEGRSALIDKGSRWEIPVPYILGDDLDLNTKGIVHQAFEVYRLKSCVDFKPYEGEHTYIKFEKKDGCYSYVGDKKRGQILSLGQGCDHKAVIEHEVLHALGFYHEQSRTDRDDYVDIRLDEVIDEFKNSFEKYNDDFITDQNTPYDYESAMHYRPFAFNKNESIPTVTTKIPEFFNVIGQYLDFSEMDMIRLNRMYNCPGSLTLLDQCSFEFANICGMIQSATDDADWIRTQSTVGLEDYTVQGQCRDSGYYMHFDTKTGNAQESALMESRTLYPKRNFQCLQFFYKMSGSPQDRLVIWVKMDDGTGTVRRMKKIHTITANAESTWKIAHVPLEVDVKFRYAFQAVRGDPSSSAGGIFVDDVSLTETRCPNAVWTISNISKLMEAENRGNTIDSPIFYSPEGYAYGIRVTPLSNYTDYAGDYMGLYFFLASGMNDAAMEWPAVNRQATMIIMDQDPDIKLRMSASRSLTTDLREADGKLLWDNPSKVGTYDASCGCYKGQSWGWNNLIKHFDLRRRSFLKNDNLIISIDFDDISSMIKTEVPIKPAE